uniref:1106 effector family protein variant n=1 Tax=Globodera rostochiensis TaxID=31243 RepID=A0A914HWG9_GLORO
MRTIFFVAIICFVLAAILESAPSGDKKDKKGVASSPTKPKLPPKSPAKAAPTSPGKAVDKSPSKKDSKAPTSPGKAVVKSPSKKDSKAPTSPKKENANKTKPETVERTPSPAKKAESAAKSPVRANRTVNFDESKPSTAGVTNANNAVKAPEKQEQSSLSMSNPSVDAFGPFEPTIVGYSEAFDEEDTSGSDFDLDFTEGEQDDDDDYSDYGEYFEDFDAFREDDPLALGNDYIGTGVADVPESVMVH